MTRCHREDVQYILFLLCIVLLGSTTCDAVTITQTCFD